MRFFGGWIAPQRGGDSDTAYHQAVRISDDLLGRMRDAPVGGVRRSLINTLMENQHNIPFLTSVYETVQEMDMPKANGRLPPH